MANAEIQVAYDSEDPNVHTMDVDQLAPSLLAIGNLCKRANAIFNGDKSTVRVLVESDFEHKCFLIHLQVVQDVYGQIQTLLHNQDIKTAKDILEWLGLIETGLGGYGLFKYLKEKRGRTPTSIKTIDKQGTVELKFEGNNNNITINKNVYQMSQDVQIISSAKAVLQPTQSPGMRSIEFRDKSHVVTKIEKSDAAEIIANEHVGDETPLLTVPSVQPQIVTARLIIHSPVFDSITKTWKFVYGESVIPVDISESGIAEDVIRRGSVRIGDAYLVQLEITEHPTAKGFRNHFRALNFSQFLPAPRTIELFNSNDDKKT